MIKRRLIVALFTVLAIAGIGRSGYADQLINGAGATFPYPIYSKWFDVYAKENPGIKFNYQSIGSGGGIRMLSNRTVDIGASDAPMTDQQLSDAPGKILHFPSVMGAVVVAYNLPGFTGTLRLTGPVIADIYSGKITKWDDDQIKALNSGRGDPIAGHRRVPSIGRQRHVVHFHRLPFESESGMGDGPGQGHRGQMAGRTRRQGQRRCDGAGSADAGRHRIYRVDICAQQQDPFRPDPEQGG